MSETCGTCRHFDTARAFKSTIQALNIVSLTVGICEREDWNAVVAETGWQTLVEAHHRHVLSAEHPAPPCHESKAKRAKLRSVSCGCMDMCQCTNNLIDAEAVALDDIKKGEEVIIS